jgi:hypothetical protein
MQETIQIFVGNNGLDLVDFYPDDLPCEWQFDYYSSSNNALMLPFDSEVDLEEICEDLDENFKLVIDISTLDTIAPLLKIVQHCKENIVLYSNNNALYQDIKEYNFCIQSDTKIAKCKHIDGYYFNNYIVAFSHNPKNDVESREIIENIAKYQENTILIFDNSDLETLKNARVITELLGFY